MNPKVYLAGPIMGCNYEECTAWRSVAKAWLAKHGIDGYSPMRGKEFLRNEPRISEGNDYDDLPLAAPSGITSRDFRDCTTSDAILVNVLGAKKPSIGTIMEIAWAHAYRVPIVLVMETTGNPNDHVFVRHFANYRVTTLDEALLILAATILP